jgi:hypothetical protein
VFADVPSSHGLLKIAAGFEIGTGGLAIASPTLFARLLFGSELSSPGPGVARLGGFALLALAVACWPTRDASEGPPLRAMLLFSVLCTAYLIYRGIRGGAIGPLLWPAAALHAVLSVFLARASRRARAVSGAP